MTDHPLTCQGSICPLCEGPKDSGPLTCWRCYDQWGLRYGYPEANPVIDGFEDVLAEAGYRSKP